MSPLLPLFTCGPTWFVGLWKTGPKQEYLVWYSTRVTLLQPLTNLHHTCQSSWLEFNLSLLSDSDLAAVE